MFIDHSDPGPDAQPEEPPVFTEAEELGLVVAGTLNRLTVERDRARAVAVRLEQDLDHIRELLESALAGWPETTWAADSHRKAILEDALTTATDPEQMP